jgi:hypothetical protein
MRAAKQTETIDPMHSPLETVTLMWLGPFMARAKTVQTAGASGPGAGGGYDWDTTKQIVAFYNGRVTAGAKAAASAFLQYSDMVETTAEAAAHAMAGRLPRSLARTISTESFKASRIAAQDIGQLALIAVKLSRQAGLPAPPRAASCLCRPMTRCGWRVLAAKLC